jgi:hypothetical protein
VLHLHLLLGVGVGRDGQVAVCGTCLLLLCNMCLLVVL